MVHRPDSANTASHESAETDDLASIRTSARGPVLVGLFCLFVTFGGVGAWGVTAPIASAVLAPGQVTVQTKRKKVQHLEGGIVRDILVRDGARVAKGQIVARLEATRARASLAIVQGAYDAAIAVEARLLAERDGKGGIAFPHELMSRVRDKPVHEIVAGQQRLFAARLRAREGQADILRQRVAQLGEEIVGLRAQQVAMDRQLALINEELTALNELFKRGHTTKRRILALRREQARLGGDRGKLIAQIARAKTSIGETKLEILQLRKTFRQEVVTELRELQTRIHDLKERRTAAAEVLRRIDIKAPVAGIVVSSAVHTIGAVLKAGDTLLEIVPSQDRLIVEARINPVDIDNVAVGQASRINLVAFKQRTTPTLDGAIVHVSADSLADERSGQPYYLAKIALGAGELEKLDGLKLQPGMPAEVQIRTGERTAVRYLVQPILDSMRRAWRED